ncbi:phosphatidylserine decarboxylase family protein [candidate division KSB1 bacterium]|nr:phosphatidylserine decarboxylase family protein [candidate division KSB1 bacterium]
MSREGLPIILGLGTFCVLVGWFGLHSQTIYLLVVASIAALLLLFVLYFFRDPRRTPPNMVRGVVSPADGQVIAIDQVHEKEFIEGKATRIAIFMSLFNVHVNYVPFKGRVDYIRYNHGAFLRANLPEASTQNAHILTGLETLYGKIAFKQATGMVARRIVNHLKLDAKVETGDKFGMIKFGSRMEVYLTTSAEIKVKVGDRVRACESIIAEFYEAH